MSDPTRPVTGYPAPPNYPYSTQPPPPQPNSYYNNYYPQQTQNYSPNPQNAFLKRIFTIIIATTILFVTITLIAYLILKPQLPVFRITSANITNFTITNTSLISFTSQIHLSSKNPNKKMSLEFDHVQAGLFYKWYTLSETNVEPFRQNKEEETDLVAGFASAGGFVDREVVDGFQRERRGNVVEFGFRLVCSVGFEAKAWRSKRFVRVFCPFVVEFAGNDGGNGTLRGSGNTMCRVVI